MHLPDSTITPIVAVAGFTALAAGAALVYVAERRDPERREHRTARDLICAAAFVFALQALHIPMLGGKYAVHMLGGAFVARRLGGTATIGVMAIVLGIQAVLGDGAWSAYRHRARAGERVASRNC